MRLTICLFISLLLIFTISAQQVNIIPQPLSVEIKKGVFIFDKKIDIVYNDSSSAKIASYLSNQVKNLYGITLKISDTHPYSNEKTIVISEESYSPKGGYELTIEPKTIIIKGTGEGLFYGVQSLLQLLPSEKNKKSAPIVCLFIKDHPRFQYRGMHLDVGRHFFPISFIKKYIDYLAYHKFNTFHWHLTEDQGWRIEIKKYPELTAIGGWRNGTIIGRYPGTGNDNIRYGGYYTQDEIKEVVQYAKERYIDVIPEIEMPGHGSAAIAAYSWLSCFPEKPTPIPANMISKTSVEQQSKGRIKLVQETWGVFDDVFCAGKDSTFMFLQNVIDEVISLFPSKYFHIGGDECPKTHWKKCPQCQKRMKDNNLKDEHELQSYFVQRIEKYLNSKGKTLIGWDEILEGGLAPKAVVMSWRGERGGIAAARQNHDVIMTPGSHVYFDHTQSSNEDSVTFGGFTPIEKVYSYEPIPDSLTKEQGKYVLGAQANVWTEYMKNIPKVEYMIFPRMAALSEVLWSPKEKRNWRDFEKRLPDQFNKYDLWKANYSKAYFDLKSMVVPSKNFDGINWVISDGHEQGLLIFRRFEQFVGKDTQLVPTTSHPVGYLNLRGYLKHEVHDSPWWRIQEQFSSTTGQFLIKKEGEYDVTNFRFWLESGDHKYLDPNYPIITLKQKFHFNRATGKKITLTNEPSKSYPGDGAFTLVNGVQNEKGLTRSREFLGFNGIDLEALIDLGEIQQIANVKAHVFEQTPSWIYRPKFMQVWISTDGELFTEMGISDRIEMKERKGIMTVQQVSVATRYIKIKLGNYGTIPESNPGAGNKAWLFVDEIEVN